MYALPHFLEQYYLRLCKRHMYGLLRQLQYSFLNYKFMPLNLQIYASKCLLLISILTTSKFLLSHNWNFILQSVHRNGTANIENSEACYWMDS